MSIHNSANTSKGRIETARNFLTSYAMTNPRWYGDEPYFEPLYATLRCQHPLPESEKGLYGTDQIHRLFGGAFEARLLISGILYNNLYRKNAPDISTSRVRATTWTTMLSEWKVRLKR
ncbi:hypothetical protein NCU07758 [Neurospora crassa OR74A]|uniref:Uncharacterized protein n=1 Tax=Neurospora crassa (strain ATCC 24698 / 74-OR23-1A / CBS 708.71 / DSM 1257 / FGSC 987) TaxID=367110 RepID=Q7S1S0_NEUCR|nr:hypothetical protein NCU07758 [Neurospora crassa OR74A]EAA29315.3 hypothetical protein NCU07758 [Neurospora crassa OR74A]|eukprot:XP_958551.3 hypothetical protein NCU07758 [Neurospora crassa OR74A]